MAQLIPLPLTVSCISKIQIDFTFLVPAHQGSPGQRPLNGCVCVCVCHPVYRYGRGHGASSGRGSDRWASPVQRVPEQSRQRAHAVRRARRRWQGLVPGRLGWSAGLLHAQSLVAAGHRQLGGRLCRAAQARSLRRRQGVRRLDPLQDWG